MQQHVPEFLGSVMVISLEYGIAQFIHLLEGLRAVRFIRLIPVPRAFDPELIQIVQDPAEGGKLFFS